MDKYEGIHVCTLHIVGVVDRCSVMHLPPHFFYVEFIFKYPPVNNTHANATGKTYFVLSYYGFRVMKSQS